MIWKPKKVKQDVPANACSQAISNGGRFFVDCFQRSSDFHQDAKVLDILSNGSYDQGIRMVRASGNRPGG
jgi:hypothetical protein